MRLDDACHVRRVEQEQNRTENAALGNAQVTNDVSNILSLTTTACVLWRTKELIQDRAAPQMPNDILSLLSKMSWSTVSKAADISNMPRSVTSPLSAAESASDTIFKTAISVE